MAFTRPTLAELRTRIQADLNSRLPGVDSALRRSFVNVLATVLAGVAHGLYGKEADTALQVIPDTADVEHLKRHASNWGVNLKAAAPATGSVTATGSNGAVIPADTLLQRSDGLEYAVLTTATIGGGTALLAIEAQTPGVAGNAGTGARLTFISPIAGVAAEALVQAPGLVDGTDEETAESLLERLLARLRAPPQGGNASDYVRWAKEVPGVTRAWAYRNWMGAGSVGVTFVLDARVSNIPLAGDREAVEAHITPLKPVTAELVVFIPDAVPLDLTVHLPGASPTVKAAIEAEFADFLRREAEPNGTVQISRLREAVFTGAGDAVHDLVSPTASVTHGAGEIAVAGDITWTV